MAESKDNERLWLRRSAEGDVEKVMTESEREEEKENQTKNDKSGESKGEAEVSKEPIWEGKPTLEAFYPFYLIGCLVSVSGVIVGSAVSLPLWVVGILVPFVATMLLLPLVFQRAWGFTITEEEVRSRFRLFVGRSKSAPLGKVTDVVVRQGPIGRIFGFGTVRVDTAGTPFAGVRFWGIKEPFKVEEKVEEVVNQNEDEHR